MCHDLEQYSNMIMSKLARETVVLYSKTPGTWLIDFDEILFIGLDSVCG